MLDCEEKMHQVNAAFSIRSPTDQNCMWKNCEDEVQSNT
jgi:hypothetical protein